MFFSGWLRDTEAFTTVGPVMLAASVAFIIQEDR